MMPDSIQAPRILVAAGASNSGKTTAVCALMWALKHKKMNVVSCKCGPDYIDPMFHREVLGVDSENLDLFFGSKSQVRKAFANHTEGADIAVIEGVMGYYDGLSLDSFKASSYDLAQVLQTPVLLVVPCKGMALSAAAFIKGIIEFRKDSNIKGIILNRISDMLYPKMKQMLESELAGCGYPIPVIGYIPENEIFEISSRHLGLVTPDGVRDIRTKIEAAGRILEKTVNLEMLLTIAKAAPPLEIERQKAEPLPDQKIRIGVAEDAAFCFYYKDNLRMLENLGCELVNFSPLKDSRLPDGINGLLLGGGYPELYARELSENTTLLENIRSRLRQGTPCLAECGGFMYLQQNIQGEDQKLYPMAGVLEGSCFYREKGRRFGYVEIQAEKDGTFLKKGEKIRGHEFHYWDCTHNGRDCLAVKPDKKRSWECIYMTGNLFAGYPHLSYASHPAFAGRFVNICRKRSEK